MRFPSSQLARIISALEREALDQPVNHPSPSYGGGAASYAAEGEGLEPNAYVDQAQVALCSPGRRPMYIG